MLLHELVEYLQCLEENDEVSDYDVEAHLTFRPEPKSFNIYGISAPLDVFKHYCANLVSKCIDCVQVSLR